VALSLGNQGQAREHAEIADRIARQIHSNPWNTWIRKIEDLFKQIDLEFPSSSQAVKGQEQVYLSQREQEVLQLLKSELSGPEIARMLYVSLNTVRYHTKNLYQKLGVNTRLEAIQRAKELGL
jgi:LuxR family maltose regulon positive regulatory protein